MRKVTIFITSSKLDFLFLSNECIIEISSCGIYPESEHALQSFHLLYERRGPEVILIYPQDVKEAIYAFHLVLAASSNKTFPSIRC